MRKAATSSSCVQRPAAVGRAVLGAAARSERVLRGVVRIEEVEVRLGQDVAVVESGEGGGDGGGGDDDGPGACDDDEHFVGQGSGRGRRTRAPSRPLSTTATS